MQQKLTEKLIFNLVMIFFVSILFIISFQYIKRHNALADVSSDAIAVRIIANPDYVSASRWYQEQGFKGSPQSLVVDGYNAIRDGRTVYVNAANVSGVCNSSGGSCTNNSDCPNNGTCQLDKLFANIYLISYNQSSEQATVDIFGQIISHWKFNTNIFTVGVCSDNNSIYCSSDSECISSGYCQPVSHNNLAIIKPQIVRDIIRLEELADMKDAIESYKKTNNYYPKLSAGTYVNNNSISVWPSWQETLSKDLGMQLPIDPINKLGDCQNASYNYNPTTCWDQNQKKFATTLPNLPANSYALIYAGNQAGTSYMVCASLETGLSISLEEGSCVGNSNMTDNLNLPPVINCNNLPGVSGKSFTTYISASGQTGHISWTNLTAESPSDFHNWTNWSLNNQKLDTSLVPNFPNLLKISAPTAGDAGNYQFGITATNSNNVSSTKTCTINISAILTSCGDGMVQAPNDNGLNEQCESAGNGTGPNNQYQCLNCLWAGGYCGDSTVQNRRELCDNGGVNGQVCSPSYGNNCQYCTAQCAYANIIGGYCGDSIVQNTEGEQCESAGHGTGTNDQYQCANCLWNGGYCGDGTVQSVYGEQCESAGHGTGTNDQYQCANCHSAGGYCGDGIIQNGQNGTINYGETCDGGITDSQARCNILKTFGVTDSDSSVLDCDILSNNQIGQNGINNLYLASCNSCVMSTCNNSSDIGKGCYIDSDGNNIIGVTECQKGVMACISNNLQCIDIFGGNLRYDYCCAGEVDKIKNNQVGTFAVVRAQESDYLLNQHYYTCDNVCKNVGMICIGVGLNDPSVDPCVSIVHDIGNDCERGENQQADDCKSNYRLGHGLCSTGYDIPGLNPYFGVGETACYCQ